VEFSDLLEKHVDLLELLPILGLSLSTLYQ
jgi:hypothetical protein